MEAETAQISMVYGDERLADKATAAATGAATTGPTAVAMSAATEANAGTLAVVNLTNTPSATPTPTRTGAQTVKTQPGQQVKSGDSQNATKPTVKQPTAVKDTTDPVSAPSNSGDTSAQTFPDPLGTAAQNTNLLTSQLKTLIKGDRFGVSIVPIGNDAAQLLQEVNVNANMQNNVASAFKGAVAIYLF